MPHRRGILAPGSGLAALGLLLCLLPAPARAGPSEPCTPASLERAAAARQSTIGRLNISGPPPDTSAFVLFGWVSPPADSTTEARIAEMAGIGLNLTVAAWLDKGCPDDNHARLDWAAAHGMRCLIWDSRLMGAYQWLPSFEDTLDEVVADYRDHPGLWGYYLGDEPERDAWPLLARLRASLRERDPTHPAWNTLVGRAGFSSASEYRAHLTDYATAFLPAVLSSDFYAFHTTDDPRFVENLTTLRDVAAARGLPFWNIVQLIPHLDYRPLEPGELRWQVTQSLAHGARGIGYFTYWTPDPDPIYDWQPAIIGNDGKRTAWYDFLQGFDPNVRLAGETLARARWRRATYAGSVPSGGLPFTPDDWIASVEGRAVIGEFEAPEGQRWVLVGNSDSLAAREVVLTTVDSQGAHLVAGGSAPSLMVAPYRLGARLMLALAAGDFALIELDWPPNRQAILVAPNPASGRVRFSVRFLTGRLRFGIFDIRGRRVWSARLWEAQSEFDWDGRDDEGRRVPPGVYFARLPGFDFGAPPTIRRFVWLGAR